MIDYEYAILEMQESEDDDCVGCGYIEGCREGRYKMPPCERVEGKENPYLVRFLEGVI